MNRPCQTARRLCIACALVAGLVCISPYVLVFGRVIADDPFSLGTASTVLGILSALVMPALPFVMLLLHLKMRRPLGDKSYDKVSRPVSHSVIIASLLTMGVTLAIFIKGVLPEEYGLIYVVCMPFVTIPVAALSCFVAWLVANTVEKRGNKVMTRVSK